jgi:hypothetical protein
MKENRKLIQIILIFTGLFLIIATYFYYPKINENKLRGSVIQDKPTDITDGANKDNTFENVEYKGLYDFDKPFIIISEKAYILSENPNIIYMADMKVTISMSDGRTVIITGDKGTYNKKTDDCFFIISSFISSYNHSSSITHANCNFHVSHINYIRIF